jgi:hypothetical protein
MRAPGVFLASFPRLSTAEGRVKQESIVFFFLGAALGAKALDDQPPAVEERFPPRGNDEG